MSLKFAKIEKSDSSFEEQIFNKGQTLTSTSDGVNHHFAYKDNYKYDSAGNTEGLLTEQGTHWAFAHTMFYMSGSEKVSEIMPADVDKFNSYYHNYNQHNDLQPFHTNKFYQSASIWYIPQAYFGNRIQPGSFQLTARTGSILNTNKEIIIKDDGNGNLYSPNAHHSQSALTAMSSSENYIGNIFYDLGMVVLTETGSWSGSATYMDIADRNDNDLTKHKDYRHWNLKFNSVTYIWSSNYSIRINAGDWDTTMNHTTRPLLSGSVFPSGSNVIEAANLRSTLTGSNWAPYFNQIHLYNEMHDDNPVMIANLPRPIKMRDDIDLIITIRVDH
tara:strand:- start:191 stop:1183 length:993 start_codon:yes stop_codon:yes gene_type:complete